jgi:hypothetical protein
MKLLRTLGLSAVMAALLTGPAFAASGAVGLGTAGGYAILAGSTITNTGPTTIAGDVGLHPGSSVTGFNTVTLSGTQHVADAAALQAKNDLVTAYNDAAGRPSTTVPAELGGSTLKTGAYNSGSFGLTGTLTLDAEGVPTNVFVFQAASSLTTASGSRVSLINGAQACNVFWEVGSSATLGTSTSFKGSILALASITMTTGASLEGRALARNGAVTLDTNVITRPSCSTTAVPTAAAPTVAPTSTSGPANDGSNSFPSLMLLAAGFAAGAAFVTIRRLSSTQR